MRRARTQAERDSVTVEIMYAAVTGALLAAGALAAIASPVLAGQAHGTAGDGWITIGVIVAAAVFCGRVGLVLRRFERTGRQPGGQPSQPGRTKPDS
ncbi:DUF6332 family protein [Streptomyces sp. NPDC059373]